jgi:Ca2+-binding RTX toxin-like protein
MSFARIGTEVLANTRTAGGQYQSAVAALSDGRFVVTWTDTGEPGGADDAGVRGQVFAADGTKLGSEFLAITTTQNFQGESAIAALTDGRFVATWRDASGPAGSGFQDDVRAQMFNVDGSRFGREFLANSSPPSSDQFEPATTGLTNGRFVVTWTDYNLSNGDPSDYGIRGQLFSADGTKFGAEFLVNTTTNLSQVDSAVIALSGGRFMVTWTDWSGIADPFATGIRGQIFSANGAKIGSERLINTTTAGYQYASSVAALADGRIVVTWTDLSVSGGDTSDAAVRGRILSASGTTIGAEFLVNTTTNGTQNESSVTGLADGRFVVTWTDRTNSIFAQVFAADGTKSGHEFVVNSASSAVRSDSSVSALPNGHFVVTWTDDSSEPYGDIRTRVFDPLRYDGTTAVDSVVGGTFVDTFNGNGGDDVVAGRAGNDILDGGEGGDTLDYSGDAAAGGSAAVGVYMTSNLAVDGFGHFDTITSFERVVGTDVDAAGYNDVILANDAANSIDARAGGDIVVAFAGDDVVYGGLGVDAIYGGSGNDILVGSNFVSSFRGEIDYVIGDAGDDALYSGAVGYAYLDGGSGHDSIVGGTVGDYVLSGSGSDTITFGRGIDLAIIYASELAAGDIDTYTDLADGYDYIYMSASLAGATTFSDGVGYAAMTIAVAGGFHTSVFQHVTAAQLQDQIFFNL